jgi:hypothetical protein
VPGRRCGLQALGRELGWRLPSRGSGFPPRGPKIEVVSANVDIEKVRKNLIEQIASDLRKLPYPELLEKYKL